MSPRDFFDIAPAEVCVGEEREPAEKEVRLAVCRADYVGSMPARSSLAAFSVLPRKTMLTDDVIDRMCSRVKLEPDRTECSVYFGAKTHNFGAKTHNSDNSGAETHNFGAQP